MKQNRKMQPYSNWINDKRNYFMDDRVGVCDLYNAPHFNKSIVLNGRARTSSKLFNKAYYLTIFGIS